MVNNMKPKMCKYCNCFIEKGQITVYNGNNPYHYFCHKKYLNSKCPDIPTSKFPNCKNKKLDIQK